MKIREEKIDTTHCFAKLSDDFFFCELQFLIRFSTVRPWYLNTTPPLVNSYVLELSLALIPQILKLSRNMSDFWNKACSRDINVSYHLSVMVRLGDLWERKRNCKCWTQDMIFHHAPSWLFCTQHLHLCWLFWDSLLWESCWYPWPSRKPAYEWSMCVMSVLVGTMKHVDIF